MKNIEFNLITQDGQAFRISFVAKISKQESAEELAIAHVNDNIAIYGQGCRVEAAQVKNI